jgi:hypothetical protein
MDLQAMRAQEVGQVRPILSDTPKISAVPRAGSFVRPPMSLTCLLGYGVDSDRLNI